MSEIVIAGALLFLLAAKQKSPPGAPRMSASVASIGWPEDLTAKGSWTWGPDRWPPPGMPASANPPGKRGSAIPMIRAQAAAEGMGDEFAHLVEWLAFNESGARLDMPGFMYDGHGITAWGAFQWQNAHVRKWFSLEYAHEQDHHQQTAGVVGVLAQLVREAGGDPRWILAWHRSPPVYHRRGDRSLAQAIKAASSKVGPDIRSYIARWEAAYSQDVA